jgi:hypothetical protein
VQTLQTYVRKKYSKRVRALKDIIMPIEVDESNLRVSKSQSNILETLYN